MLFESEDVVCDLRDRFDGASGVPNDALTAASFSKVAGGGAPKCWPASSSQKGEMDKDDMSNN